MLELACNWMYEYPVMLKRVIWDNYLVNPSGHPVRWHEGDLLQEHNNREIKKTFNPKNSRFDSDWMQNAVSPNIRPLGTLRRGLYKILGLSYPASGRTQARLQADIETLARRHLADSIHVFVKGRSQPFIVPDGYAQGFSKLAGGQLSTFLERTKHRVSPREE
jgi:hypothetical protein